LLSTKRWFGVMLLSIIPVVNIVLLFVWAFSSKTKEKEYSLRTYSRATLIFALVWIVACIAATFFIPTEWLAN
jgi:NADH:ubiquinone oxidoreductase subunit 3 (subunit A)